ncbi:hypothetical protein TYRP_018061 [Tyrophagus putrescentiae]|nr:hypothetical protein TYRP_018061 [Tyrophagus putrescentiae]
MYVPALIEDHWPSAVQLYTLAEHPGNEVQEDGAHRAADAHRRHGFADKAGDQLHKGGHHRRHGAAHRHSAGKERPVAALVGPCSPRSEEGENSQRQAADAGQPGATYCLSEGATGHQRDDVADGEGAHHQVLPLLGPVEFGLQKLLLLLQLKNFPFPCLPFSGRMQWTAFPKAGCTFWACTSDQLLWGVMAMMAVFISPRFMALLKLPRQSRPTTR